MIGTIIGLLVLIALVVLFGWLAMRAWGSKHKVLKWVGLILAGLLTLLFVLVFVVALMGTFKLYAPASNPVADIKVAGTADQIARGQKIAGFCAGCHSTTSTPPLNGGEHDFLAGPGVPPVGTLYAPNLTPAGEIKNWSDGEIIRAIREGIHKSGRPLIIMPAEVFHNLSDADVQSVVAYLRSQPAVPNKPQNDTPTNGLSLLGAVFVGAGLFPTTAQTPITSPIIAPPEGPTSAYGKYLIAIIGCSTCHGADLAGGTPSGFGPPAGPNLTALVPKWTQAQFSQTIRTGVDPTGHALDPRNMPWKEISAFATDDDVTALYNYLHGLTPIDKSQTK